MNLALMKKEFDDILSERLYIFAFFAQFVIVMGILFAAILYTSVAAPETSTLVQVQRPRIGILGVDLDIESRLQESLDVVRVGSEPFQAMKEGDFVAVLEIKSENDFEVYLDNTKLLSSYADTIITDVLSVRSAELKKKGIEEKVGSADIVLEPIRLREMVVGEKTLNRPPEFIVIMYGLLIPFILLLPTFLAMNMVTDSIVGEKERKTYEALVSSPLTKRTIVLSKSIPIILIALAQSFTWMLLLRYRGIPIYNISMLLLLLLIINALFIGVGVFISAFSETLKESNLTVTITILVASIFMFAPLSLRSKLQLFNPLLFLTKLASNQEVSLKSMSPLIPIVFLAIGVLYAGEVVLRRRETLRL